MSIERKNVADADEVADYGEQGDSARLTLGETGFGIASESTVWLSRLRPGWSWERNIKPDVPFETCPLHHREYIISGRIQYTMEDGTQVEAGPGDPLLIEPGHLAQVIGDEECVALDW